MAHVCVSTTARQAAERGYDVVVVRDGVGDRDSEFFFFSSLDVR